MISRTAVIGGIEVKITKKSTLKNLYIRINPPKGNVTISAPLHYPDDDISLFVLKKLPEINAVRARMRSQLRQNKREFQARAIIYGANHIVLMWQLVLKNTVLKKCRIRYYFQFLKEQVRQIKKKYLMNGIVAS